MINMALIDEIRIGNYQPTTSELVDILEQASDQYYNNSGSDEPQLSDAEYDHLERLLKQMDPGNPYLSTVGSNVRGGKVDLPYPMGSLDQVYEGDTLRWVQSNGWLDESFVITDKLDGTSGQNIHGKGGKFQASYSRGNGIKGADVTRHVVNMRVPTKTESPAAVRVEFIMPIQSFNNMMTMAKMADERVYKNPRNYTAGRMNASEGVQDFYDNVAIVATGVISPKMSKLDQLEFLRRSGYEIPHIRVVQGRDLTDEFLTKHLNDRRAASPYELDGIVIDIENADIRAALRRNSSSLNPMYSKKFKVGAESNLAVTQVVKVHYEPSKLGYLKPRVEIQPVDLTGVTITYATGFNCKFIRDNEIGPGAEIQITRSGDVIPFIKAVNKPSPSGAQLPTEAEFGPMLWTKGDVDMYLVDLTNNRDVQINRMIDTFTILDVPHLRQGSIEKLYDAGYDSAAKIILADESTLQNVVGNSAGEKIHQGIKLKLNGVEPHVLAAASQTLGRGIGRRKLIKLVEAYGRVDDLTVQDIVAVEGFETTTAQLIVDNMPRYHDFLKEIQGYYTIAQPKAKVQGGALSQVNVCFTGVRDKDLEAIIEAKGGTIASGVNAKTTHLVSKDPNSNSGKMEKARKFGLVPGDTIIDLQTARKLWI